MKITQATVHICVESIGFDPERAEPGNPRGEATSKFGYAEATDFEGRAFLLSGLRIDIWNEPEKMDGLEKLVAKINAAGEINADLWDFYRWTYGSKGWQEQELDAEIRDAERAGERHPMSF